VYIVGQARLALLEESTEQRRRLAYFPEPHSLVAIGAAFLTRTVAGFLIGINRREKAIALTRKRAARRGQWTP
jgi:hypothetical protein